MSNARQVDILLSGLSGNDGAPLSGGKVYCYNAGSDTLKNVYDDVALTLASPNPVVLDANGRALKYALGNYKLVVKDAEDTLLYTFDNLGFGYDNVSGAADYAGSIYCAAGGNTSAIQLNTDLETPISTYTEGMRFVFKAWADISAGATLQVDDGTAIALYKADGSGAIDNDDIAANNLYEVVFDGVYFRIFSKTSAINTSDIADASITTNKLTTNAVTAIKITDGDVTTTKIADGAVTTAKIADSNVTTGKIVDSAITTAKIDSKAVTTAKIDDKAVTYAQIADNTITASQIASNAIETAEIKDGAVTTAKIANGNVTDAKLASSFIKNNASSATITNLTTDTVYAGKNFKVNPSGISYNWTGSGTYTPEGGKSTINVYGNPTPDTPKMSMQNYHSGEIVFVRNVLGGFKMIEILSSDGTHQGYIVGQSCATLVCISTGYVFISGGYVQM